MTMNYVRRYSYDNMVSKHCPNCGLLASGSIKTVSRSNVSPIPTPNIRPECLDNRGKMTHNNKMRGKKKENIRNRQKKKREKEREKEKEKVVDIDFKKDIVTIKRDNYDIYENMLHEKNIKFRNVKENEPYPIPVITSTTVGDPKSLELIDEREDNDVEKQVSSQNSNCEISVDNIDNGSLLVDLTHEECWKQNKNRDKGKDSQNVNKITRYGVGYKKCLSHCQNNPNYSKYDNPNLDTTPIFDHSQILGNTKLSNGVNHNYGPRYYGYSRHFDHSGNSRSSMNSTHPMNSGHSRHSGHHNVNGYCKYSNKAFSRPNVFCSNCGAYGYLYRNCNYAITSYGIICFRFKTDKDTITPEYLMVQRHKSLNYVEFVRGKWSKNNRKYLIQMFSNMTEEERSDIGNLGFAQIWKGLWKKKEFNSSDREYRESKAKFDDLKNGYLIENKDGSRIRLCIDYLLTNSKSTISESEWGFPKGKRLNEKESDFNCAMREFVEETSIKPSFVDVKTYKPYEEEFSGSNNIRYKHVYYLAQCSTNNDKIAFSKDINDIVDIDEIRNVIWFKHTDGLEMIRSSNPQRKDLFTRVNNCVMKNLEVRIKR